jgi:hypothetical protein
VEELKVETLLAMNIAATLTQAACAGSGGSLPVSAQLAGGVGAERRANRRVEK